MAKKNLHTKRLNVNGESHQKAEITPPAGLGFTTGMNSSNGNGNHGNQVAGSNPYPRRRSHLDAPIIDSVFSTGSTGPAPGLNGYDFTSNTLTKERSASGSDLGSLYSETLGSLPSRPSLLKETSFLERSNSGFMELFDSPTSTLSRGSSTTLVDSIDSLFINEKGPPPNSAERVNSVPGDRGFSSALFSSESLLSRRVFSSIPLESSGTTGTSNNNSMDFFPPLNSTSLLNGTSSLGSSLSSFGNESSNESTGNGSTLSTTVANNSGVLLNIDMSDPNASLARLGISGGDQNPPCNTLYVGNLPMDASEEELRAIFSSCTGYKRLCFKNKSNGPMCFVEVSFKFLSFFSLKMFNLLLKPFSNCMEIHCLTLQREELDLVTLKIHSEYAPIAIIVIHLIIKQLQVFLLEIKDLITLLAIH